MLDATFEHNEFAFFLPQSIFSRQKGYFFLLALSLNVLELKSDLWFDYFSCSNILVMDISSVFK